MDVIVKAKCDVSQRVKDEAVERVEHAVRFFDRLQAVELVFGAENNPRIPEPAVVELTAHTKGHHIRAQGWGADHRAALDVAVARFERQLARYKARLVSRNRRTLRGAVPAAAASYQVEPPDGPPEPEPRVVRTKRFTLTAMTIEDAALHLELLDHDFYLFTNMHTGRSNVVYRRKDGDLGLIEPDETPPAAPTPPAPATSAAGLRSAAAGGGRALAR